MDFPTLYQIQGNRVWYLRVTQDNVIERKYGVFGGVLTTSTKTITTGKNIGKRNQTSPFEQACSEAKSLFKKQIDSGYSEIRDTRHTMTFPSPMLAHGYDKHSHKIQFPAFVQPKLDGVRMLCGYHDHKIVCISRTGKPFPSSALDPIIMEAQKILIPGMWLDGELYSQSITFEEIVSACRKETSDINIEFHVYDLLYTDTAAWSFEDRHKKIQELIPQQFNKIKRVDTYTVDNHDQVCEYHDVFVKHYEGIMIRNKNSPYKQTRSYDLQKFKNFQDNEFVIVDIKEAIGNDTGTAIIQCKTEQGNSFWVRPRGTREYRAEMLRQKDLLMYKLMTVRYQNLTDKGIPRFPVGIVVRDYE